TNPRVVFTSIRKCTQALCRFLIARNRYLYRKCNDPGIYQTSISRQNRLDAWGILCDDEFVCRSCCRLYVSNRRTDTSELPSHIGYMDNLVDTCTVGTVN